MTARAHEQRNPPTRLVDQVAASLARAPTWSPTVDDLVRHLDAPPDGVRAALESLVQAGIVERRGPRGRRYRLRSFV
jgi:DNA-binding IclR family transcriptional regulator